MTTIIHIGFAMIILLLLHHRYIHRNDKDKTGLQKWFQLRDVKNHETVELIILGIIIGLLI